MGSVNNTRAYDVVRAAHLQQNDAQTLIIFDVDAVLLRFYETFDKAFNELLKEYVGSNRFVNSPSVSDALLTGATTYKWSSILLSMPPNKPGECSFETILEQMIDGKIPIYKGRFSKEDFYFIEKLLYAKLEHAKVPQELIRDARNSHDLACRLVYGLFIECLYLRDLKPIQGMDEIVGIIQKYFPVVILTNLPDQELYRVKRRIDLAKYFNIDPDRIFFNRGDKFQVVKDMLSSFRSLIDDPTGGVIFGDDTLKYVVNSLSKVPVANCFFMSPLGEGGANKSANFSTTTRGAYVSHADDLLRTILYFHVRSRFYASLYNSLGIEEDFDKWVKSVKGYSKIYKMFGIHFSNFYNQVRCGQIEKDDFNMFVENIANQMAEIYKERNLSASRPLELGKNQEPSKSQK